MLQSKNPKEIVLVTPDDVYDLFKNSFSSMRVVHCHSELSYFDYGVFLATLPYLFNAKKQDICKQKAYLFSNASMSFKVLTQ